MADSVDAVARIDRERLVVFAGEVLRAAGMKGESVRTTAHFLVEADMAGYGTHGVALIERYAASLADGGMKGDAEPAWVSQEGGALVLDGRMAPGLHTLAIATARARELAAEGGTASIAIRNAHHVGALGVFLPQVTEAGMMGIIASSSPGVAAVAPHGGKSPVLSPNPVALGIPTSRDPLIIDTSASITTLGRARAADRQGVPLPGLWAVDPGGKATDDAGVLWQEPSGALLPAGGLDHGHKGFALAILVEALTQGLGGFGRADVPTAWTNAVYVHVIDPEAFAGIGPFRRQMDRLVELCVGAEPIDPASPVRMPGAHGLARRRTALTEGVPVAGGTLAALDRLAGVYGLPPLAER